MTPIFFLIRLAKTVFFGVPQNLSHEFMRREIKKVENCCSGSFKFKSVTACYYAVSDNTSLVLGDLTNVFTANPASSMKAVSAPKAHRPESGILALAHYLH